MINDDIITFSPAEREFGNFLLRNAGKTLSPEETEVVSYAGATLFRAWSRGCYSTTLNENEIALLAKCSNIVSLAHELRVTPLVIDEDKNIAIYRYFELENFISEKLCDLIKLNALQIIAIDFCDAEKELSNLIKELHNSGASVVLAMPDNRDDTTILNSFPEIEIRRFSDIRKSRGASPISSGKTLLISDCELLTPEIAAHFLKLRDSNDPIILCGDPDNSVIPGGTHRLFASLVEAMRQLCCNRKKPNPALTGLRESGCEAKNISFFPYSALKEALQKNESDQLVVFAHQSGPLSAETMLKAIFPGDLNNQKRIAENCTTWMQAKKSSAANIKIILPLRDYDFLDFDHIQLLLNPVRQSIEVFGDAELWQLAASRKITSSSRTANICKKLLQELY